MAPPTATQLSDGDAIFLSMESPNSGGHVGAVLLLDPSTCEDFSFDKLRSHIASRTELIPRFSWKLQSVPLGVDRPYWVEAEGFHPRDNIIRTAVPSPGNIQQVYALASRLHAQPLDRSRPLWQVWFIEGIEGGGAAIYMKTHQPIETRGNDPQRWRVICDGASPICGIRVATKTPSARSNGPVSTPRSVNDVPSQVRPSNSNACATSRSIST